MEFISKIVDIVLPPVVKTVVTNVAYPFEVGKNVKDLKSAKEELAAKKHDIENKIADASREGQTRTEEVRLWQERVASIEGDVEKIEKDYRERVICVNGCSLNCWSNYMISRSAAKKLLEVQKLKDSTFEEIVVPRPPSAVQKLSNTLTMPLRVDTNLELAREYINNDDVGVIGIWGMGGVGKTRLLQQINNSFSGDTSFDCVIFITASRECSVEMIQRRILEELKRIYKELNCDLEDAQSRKNCIFNRLSKLNFLLLLDDLWNEINLETVGIPRPLGLTGQYKRKVALTTRSRNVFGLMEVRKEIKVACLNEEDALHLFMEKVGLKKVGDATIDCDPDILSLARNVVHELDGLPLALITVGRAMFAIKEDRREWNNAIDRLRKSRLDEVEISSEEDKVFHKLKFSYESLSSNILRECFLACSLWPEDYNIQKPDLIECWLGLGILEGSYIPGIYSKAYSLIGELQRACLLEFCEEEDFVKMHDVIRDMALWIAFDYGKSENKWIVKQETESQEVTLDKLTWCKAERIALWNGRCVSIPNNIDPINLTTLIIRCPLQSHENLKSFTTTLTYLDIFRSHLREFPIVLCSLVNLRYLNLSNNDIEVLPEDLKLLINLQYLLLQDNPIRTVPNGVVSELKRLRVLDLFNWDALGGDFLSSVLVNSPSLLEELGHLDNLKAVGLNIAGHTQFEELTKFSNLPFRSLMISHLDKEPTFTLSSSFLGSVSIRKNLFQLYFPQNSDVEQFVIESSSELEILEELSFAVMEELKEVVWKGLKPKDLFPRLSRLDIFACSSLKNISWILCLPCLQVLFLVGCDGMQQLIISGEGIDTENIANAEKEPKTYTPTFPCLKQIYLDDLGELHSICDPGITFPSLEIIDISDCPKLKKLPFLPHTIPSKLKRITAENLEWENDSVKSSLEKFVNILY